MQKDIYHRKKNQDFKTVMSNEHDARIARRLVASSTTGTTFLILIQVASRAFTFAANQLVLRHLSPTILGAATQLELLSTTVLFFSRESIRTAIQRQPPDSAYDVAVGENDRKVNGGTDARIAQSAPTQSVVNVSYLSLFLGFPLSLMITAAYVWFASEEVSQKPYFLTSVAITGLSAFLELCTEPFFAVVQQHMLYRTRAIAETAAAFMKSAAICTAYIFAANRGWQVGVLPYAIGFLGHSFALGCGYAIMMNRSGTQKRPYSILLSRIVSADDMNFIAGLFSRPLMTVAGSVFFQSTVKHLLTQGDAMMLAAMSSLEDQGIYSFASNYGGLIARILFQPIEESSRNLFSSLLPSSKSATQINNNISVAKSHLLDILRAYGLLSIFIFPLGPTFIPLLLRIIAGHRWTHPKIISLLSTYSFYIPFLAFNGISEAFVSATASPADLRKQTGWMGVFSACFAFAAFLFLRVGQLGVEGLVWANIVNMIVRTIWSFYFIRSYLRRHGNDLTLADVSLQKFTYAVAAVAISATLTQRDGLSETNLSSLPLKLALGSTYALIILYLERDYLTIICLKIYQMVSARVASKNRRRE